MCKISNAMVLTLKKFEKIMFFIHLPYRLYDTVLNHLAKSRGDLLLWDGSLSAVTAASTLDTVASPFLQDSASSTERDLAIVALHERHRFNNEVVFGALCR